MAYELSKKNMTRREFLQFSMASMIAFVGGMVIPSVFKSQQQTSVQTQKQQQPQTQRLDLDTIKKIKKYSMGWWQNVDGVDTHEDLKKLGLI